ncbi:MAG: hypothetical protein FWD60_09720 [Candidatus Azobacteroides sp.]|nr:hypothetical protein [Candidatus Azobacteroides sp.]
METSVVNVPLNETQILLLQSFSRIKSEKERADIQAILLEYYRKRVDAQANNISLSNEKIEEILNTHYRTPYK